jgi:hypothetical protein
MTKIRRYFRMRPALPLLAAALVLFVPLRVSRASPVKLGIFVFENIEGYHTQSSTFGTRVGAELLSMCDDVKVEDSVPLESNETVRILEEMTEDRKVVVTTLHAAVKDGVVEYPAVVFADDAVKFADLTWKVDDGKALEAAKKAGLSHCLIGTCKGLVTPPDKESAAGRRGLSAVTASVNVRLLSVSSGKAEWMDTYRQVVSHTDARIGFEEAVEMVATRVAEDLAGFFGGAEKTSGKEKE